MNLETIMKKTFLKQLQLKTIEEIINEIETINKFSRITNTTIAEIINNKKITKTKTLEKPIQPNSLTTLTDGKVIALDQNNQMVYDVLTGKQITILPEPIHSDSLTALPDGGIIALDYIDNQTVYWVDFNNEKTIPLIEAFEKINNTEYTQLLIEQFNETNTPKILEKRKEDKEFIKRITTNLPEKTIINAYINKKQTPPNNLPENLKTKITKKAAEKYLTN